MLQQKIHEQKMEEMQEKLKMEEERDKKKREEDKQLVCYINIKMLTNYMEQSGPNG